MAVSTTIALDAMGGDQAPDFVVQGADIALERMPDLRLVLVGEEPRITDLVAKTRRLRSSAVEIVPSDEIVGADERPSAVLRRGRRTSMRVATDLVANGTADGVVSAGNTGAFMALSKFLIGTCPGITRPAIAGFFPTLRGETCVLDLGANIECDTGNYVQFAMMGAIFTRIVLGLETPSVGLLNVGSEEQKGYQDLRDAADVLRNCDMPLSYHGFVEGNDLATGSVDVIVTNGFTGNIALKTAEGSAQFLTSLLRDSFRSSWTAKLGYLLCRRALSRTLGRVDPRHRNGAVFLGLNSIVVKSHGGTDRLGFANAICVAANMARFGFLDSVREELSVQETVQGENSVPAALP